LSDHDAIKKRNTINEKRAEIRKNGALEYKSRDEIYNTVWTLIREASYGNVIERFHMVM
jgi:hypothetical protein